MEGFFVGDAARYNDGLGHKVKLRLADGLPTQIHVSITDRCCLPCRMCDIWRINPKEEMTTNEWKGVFDQIAHWVGPVYEAKPGTVMLAQISGAPIVPLAGAAESYWRLRSWDRTIVPKPFSKVKVAVGEPIHVPEKISSEELAEYTQLLKERLDALVQAAESAVA